MAVESNFFNSPLYSDIAIQVDGTTFYGHRLVLHSSEYFRTLFASKMKETAQAVLKVNIEGISASCMEAYLRYLYDQPLDKLTSFAECIILLKETERFLTPSLRQYLIKEISQYHKDGLQIEDTITYLETMAQYNIALQVRPIDYNVYVLCSLSFDAVYHLVQASNLNSYIPILYWVASHPKESVENLSKLIDRCVYCRIPTRDIPILETYQDMPILTRPIIKLLVHSATNSGKLAELPSLSLTYSCSAVQKIKHQIDQDGSYPEIRSELKVRRMTNLIDHYITVEHGLVIKMVSDDIYVLVGRTTDGWSIISPTPEDIHLAESLGMKVLSSN